MLIEFESVSVSFDAKTALDNIKLAKASYTAMGVATTAKKNEALQAIAHLLPIRADEIITANRIDIERGIEKQIGDGLIDRLMLNQERIIALANAISQVITLHDPVGEVVRSSTLANGLKLSEVGTAPDLRVYHGCAKTARMM